MDIKRYLSEGRGSLGIELGSTRIKAVVIDDECKVIAIGSHSWENKFKNNIWTYSIEDIWQGVRACYTDLKKNIYDKFGVEINSFKSIGISGMMHGYMAFDKNGEILTPFRTWRNTMTSKAAYELSEYLDFNIPERWSIAHLYQAVLDKEEHVSKIDYITTLSGYIHWKLTGNKVLGIGDASGMFPIDIEAKDYNKFMIDKFDVLLEENGYEFKLSSILPKVLVAGEYAGKLTNEGALLLDESKSLKEAVMFCAPEGDAGTGMVATKSITKRTGNISAGTSIFAMFVLEKELKGRYKEVDMVTTPDGKAVAMVHANNCTSDINSWINIFKEFSDLIGVDINIDRIFSLLYNKALEGATDVGALLSYAYLSGESITDIEEGRPLFVRRPDSIFNLANFMRMHLYSIMATMKIGMEILTDKETVAIDKLYAHGGLFKTKKVAQKIMADALNIPITVMENAGEGGPWGQAVLASYAADNRGMDLDSFLDKVVFKDSLGAQIEPEEAGSSGFLKFMESYKAGLVIEKQALESI